MEAARYTLENDKKCVLLQIKNVRSQPSPSSSTPKTGCALPPKSQDIRTFSAQLYGRGGRFPSTSTITRAVHSQDIKKENDQVGSQDKEMKKSDEETFGDDDDDELENAMLNIDTEQEPNEKKSKLADGKDDKHM